MSAIFDKKFRNPASGLIQIGHKFASMTLSSKFFDVSVFHQVQLLAYILANIWGLSRVRDSKSGMNVFNEKLLNAAK